MSEFTNIPISIVDDDAAVRDSLSLLLSIAGFSVSTYESGAGFLASLKDCATNVLIVDMHMPGLSGVELAEQLRSRGCTIPVILISGNLDTATRDQGARAGISRFLKKPFSGTRLIETIREISN